MAFFVSNQYIIICLLSFTLAINLQGMAFFFFYESVLIKICENCFKGFHETYLFCEDTIDIFHYMTQYNIYLNICTYVYLPSFFCIKKKVSTYTI